MWETIKNDPVLRTVTIIILSVLGFGFAFNIMFGPSSRGMGHGGEMGGGYSLGDALSNIFVLAFKLLLIALVIVALMAIFKFARKHLIEGGEIKMFDSIKNDPVLKGITIAVLLVIAFGLIYYLFAGILGFSGGYGMMNGYGFGISGFLALLIKILLFASVAGLIIGLVMFVRQSYGKDIAEKLSSIKVNSKPNESCSNCGSAISTDFQFCPSCGGKVKEQCTTCGTEIQKDWKCCPVCGNETAAEETKPQKGKRG